MAGNVFRLKFVGLSHLAPFSRSPLNMATSTVNIVHRSSSAHALNIISKWNLIIQSYEPRTISHSFHYAQFIFFFFWFSHFHNFVSILLWLKSVHHSNGVIHVCSDGINDHIFTNGARFYDENIWEKINSHYTQWKQLTKCMKKKSRFFSFVLLQN